MPVNAEDVGGAREPLPDGVNRLRFLPLLYGEQLSVKCYIVGPLVLVWADHRYATVEPAVVTPIDPSSGYAFDVLFVLNGPS